MWNNTEKSTAAILLTTTSVFSLILAVPSSISIFSGNPLTYVLLTFLMVIRIYLGPFLLLLLYLSGSPSSREYLKQRRLRLGIPAMFIIAYYMFLPFMGMFLYWSSNGNLSVFIFFIAPLIAFRSSRQRFEKNPVIASVVLSLLLIVLFLGLGSSPYYRSFTIFMIIGIPALIVTLFVVGPQQNRDLLKNRRFVIGIFGVFLLLLLNFYTLLYSFTPMGASTLTSILSLILLPSLEIGFFYKYGYDFVKERVGTLTGVTGWFRYYLITLIGLAPTLFLIFIFNYFAFPLLLSLIFLFSPLVAYSRTTTDTPSTDEVSSPKHPMLAAVLKIRNLLFLASFLSSVSSIILRTLYPNYYQYLEIFNLIGIVFFFAPAFLVAIVVLDWIAGWMLQSSAFSRSKAIRTVLMGLLLFYYYAAMRQSFFLYGWPIYLEYLIAFLSLILYSPLRKRIDGMSGGRLGQSIGMISERRGNVSAALLVIGAALVGFNYRGLSPFAYGTIQIIALIIGVILIVVTIYPGTKYILRTVSSYRNRLEASLRNRQFERLLEGIDENMQELVKITESPPLRLYSECEDLALQYRANAYVGYREIRAMTLSQDEETESETAIKEIENQFEAAMAAIKEKRPRYYDSTDTKPSALPADATSSVEVLRGCEVIGGTFEYKPKIVNRGSSVVTNVTATIVAYPDDCLDLAGDASKTISRIEVGGFRSPQFLFTPSKDCVEGTIVASVSYMDARDQLQTIEVSPYRIRSVCDLLVPLELEKDSFALILGDMISSTEEEKVQRNAQVLFNKTQRMMRSKNFHIVDVEEHASAGQFIGTIRGLAEGKYTNKRIAVIVAISGNVDGDESVVKVEALGDDIAMLPTTIHELEEGIKSWTCLKCGASLETDQVTMLKSGMNSECGFCYSTLKSRDYIRDA